ncbi:FAD-dependent oxidoreductase [Acidisphaera rubrifaciens]|uniref:NADH:ubiquinone reductase (non-electrogenic) n=1 Tax=Acidisphaera rubrifaciens HS-AP3 TaxID=1231350 RepID=A0A0D6P3P3_9PROT|nr:FAD-dependent oxidoreductase [Acidisphaera rubrifaciens]GAN76380.1 FAD dependent pyridine nucleotide-disulfide oxidoreductase [Acidisphaera rubrifaciens HS-AP3]
MRRIVDGMGVGARTTEALLAPWLSLLIRLWLAPVFIVAGVHQMMGAPGAHAMVAWQPALLQEITSSSPGVAIQAICPVLLALGLFTRLGALALVLQAVFLPVAGFGPDARLLWAALLVSLFVYGAGPFSFDRLLRRGAHRSAVPGVARIATVSDWLTRRLGAMFPLAALGVLAITSPWLASADVRPYWALLLVVALTRAAGRLGEWLGRPSVSAAPSSLPHVVVVGGGFGGISAVRGLRGAPCRTTLIDRRNYHLFQPLLYQVATASLSPGDIATPIRGMLRRHENARVLLGEVTGIAVEEKAVVLDRGRIPYDYLVIATGARHSYFGRDEWAPFAPGLKSVEDATAMRARLLRAFEEAENAEDVADRAAWLTFVIVGGGPTGVELAGAIAELAAHGLEGEFRVIDPSAARILLVEAGPRLLATFPEPLSREARLTLERLGVEVRAGNRVDAIAADHVVVSGEILPVRTVFWAAGVMASPAARWLGVSADRAGRVPVEPDLSVPGLNGVFAVGDTASSRGWHGQPVPGLAPAAKQGGAYVARVIRARLTGAPQPEPFRYRHLGSLATIGRQAAVADFGLVRLRGAIAWWLWGVVHVGFLVGGRNRMIVMLDWLWAYLTFRRGTGLITDSGGGAPAAETARSSAAPGPAHGDVEKVGGG